ncbi:MAG: hypothetical protein QMD46_10215 [Methanomicrobiales archaeon]|nr:hypothetical protein [Methanomicrobiales archaeon]MDI6877044.1 hypothetical protein [Methanomicrobiales archaeon]
MRSQVKWGIILLVIGLVLAPIGFPYLLVYAVPLILIGLALIAFRRREETLEEIRE